MASTYIYGTYGKHFNTYGKHKFHLLSKQRQDSSVSPALHLTLPALLPVKHAEIWGNLNGKVVTHNEIQPDLQV